MSTIVGSHRLRRNVAAALFCTFCLLLATCKPWTIRPIESRGEKPAAASQQFNAEAYVDSIWESKILPTVKEKAVDLPALLTAIDADIEVAKQQYGRTEIGGAMHFIVKCEGRINRVNASSQNRTISLALPGYKGKSEVLMQAGPVFRGTSIRDAVGFIQFNQFVNQLQYADVGNKLNDRVSTSVLKGFDPATAEGRHVSFYGAFTLGDRARIVITPVIFETGGQP